MNLHINFCFICLKEHQVLQGLVGNEGSNETDYAKLTTLIPEMVREVNY